MTNQTRAVPSSLCAFMFGCVGGLIVAVLGPLLFPASISGPSQGESIVVFSMQASSWWQGPRHFWKGGAWDKPWRAEREDSE